MTNADTALRPHVDDVVDAALKRERVVGTVVLISLCGQIVYQRAAGFADREANVSMQEDTLFRFASLTKPIVSAVALALVAKRCLALDEPVDSWLPGFCPKSNDGGIPTKITVRHLLTHTAGLDYGFGDQRELFQRLGVSNGLDLPGVGSTEQLSRLASVPLCFEPGTAWRYSLATDVLGLLLEQAGRRDLPSLVQEIIGQPLGWVQTGFTTAERQRLATPYFDGMPRPRRMAEVQEVPNQDGLIRFSPDRFVDHGSFPSGGAGMIGTAEEFLRFLEAIRTGGTPILDEISCGFMTTDQLPRAVQYPRAGWRFSMGAEVLIDRRLTRTPHDEGTWRWGGGYGHDWFVNPSRGLSVVSLTNTTFEGSDGAYPQNLRDAIYYALMSAE